MVEMNTKTAHRRLFKTRANQVPAKLVVPAILLLYYKPRVPTAVHDTYTRKEVTQFSKM